MPQTASIHEPDQMQAETFEPKDYTLRKPNSKSTHSNAKILHSTSWKTTPSKGQTTPSKGKTTGWKARTTGSIHKPRVSGSYPGPEAEGRGDGPRCCHGDQNRQMMCWPEVLASQWETRGMLTGFSYIIHIYMGAVWIFDDTPTCDWRLSGSHGSQ